MESKMNIHLDEATHIYTVNGDIKPSVTQKLKSVGILDDYDGIDEYYMHRGTAVHDYCELLAQGWLDWETIEVDSAPYFARFERLTWEDCEPYVRTFERLIFELGLSYVSSEALCYDPEYDYCGKYDLIMMWEGKRTLVELKTGVFPMWGGLQLAAYERMVEVEDVLGVSLKDGGKVFIKAPDYHLNHDVWADINEGRFVFEDWKSDTKRRRMKVLRRAA